VILWRSVLANRPRSTSKASKGPPTIMSLSIKTLALFAAGALAQRQRLLSPASDINSPAGANAKEPLKWVGANGPWFPGEFAVLQATTTALSYLGI